MSFRDEQQRREVCNLLARRVRSKGIHFDEDGASAAAVAIALREEALSYWKRLLDGFSYHQAAKLQGEVFPLRVDDEPRRLVVCASEPEAKERWEKPLTAVAKDCRLPEVVFAEERGELPYLSSGERVMALAAMAVWNEAGGLKLSEALHSLDGENLELLGSLLVAMADGSSLAVERWLVEHSEPHEGGADA